MVDDDDPEEHEAALQLNEALGGSKSMGTSHATLATQASATKNGLAATIYHDDADSKGPLNDESSSNVLFHPPAAHEEYSLDTDNEDSHFGLESTVATNVASNG